MKVKQKSAILNEFSDWIERGRHKAQRMRESLAMVPEGQGTVIQYRLAFLDGLESWQIDKIYQRNLELNEEQGYEGNKVT